MAKLQVEGLEVEQSAEDKRLYTVKYVNGRAAMGKFRVFSKRQVERVRAAIERRHKDTGASGS